MMEAEARWHAGVTSQAVPKEHFLKVSKPQLEWLQRHHQRSALVQMGSTLSTRHSLQSVSSHNLRASLHAKQSNTSAELPTTQLSSLDSQYVGPIGIGTVMVPQGCQSESLIYMPHERASGSSQSCHSEEQSEVWVVFDTGSTILWEASDLCTTGGCANSSR